MPACYGCSQVVVLSITARPQRRRCADHRQLPRRPLLRLRIVECLVLIVLQENPRGIHVHHIVAGEQGNLATPARGIDHEVRDRHPAGVALQRLNDIQPRFDRSAEVIRTFGQVRLVEIVGFDASEQELMHQSFHESQDRR